MVNRATLGKEVDGVIEYIYPKTSADMVEYTAEMTVKQKIQSIDADITATNSRINDKVSNPPTGVVGQILEIETVENGRPKTYKSVNKPREVTDEQISNAIDNYMTTHPFEETDPTIPDWAKKTTKPTYTASEVGAVKAPSSNGTSGQILQTNGDGTTQWVNKPTGGITEETDPTVPDWAKKTTKPTYTADEVGALPDTTKIPSKTSDLQNDSGFLTQHQDLSRYALKSEIPNAASDIGAESEGTAESKVSDHNVSDTAHNDIRLLVQGLTERLNTLADSDDATLDQMSEIVAYIKSNKSLIDAITTGKINVSDIIDNLTTNASNKPLSAAQGVILKSLVDKKVNLPKDKDGNTLNGTSGQILQTNGDGTTQWVNKPTTGTGGITEETDPTVPDWAKEPEKPTYTASEVGALDSSIIATDEETELHFNIDNSATGTINSNIATDTEAEDYLNMEG